MTKMAHRINISLIVLLILSKSTVFAGGGWTLQKGRGYFKLNQSVLWGANYFNPEGDRIEILPRLGYYATSIYGEYGITDQLDVIVYFPFFARATQNDFVRLDGSVDTGDAFNSVGDSELTLKWGILRDMPIVLSASLTLGLPFGNPAGGESMALQTGDGEFNQMVLFHLSHSLKAAPVYVSTYSGINNRTKDLSDEFRFGLEAGYTGFPKTSIILKYYGVRSLRNGDPSPNENPGIFNNNMEYSILAPEVNYVVYEQIGVSASVAVPLSGKQFIADPSYNLGVFFNL